MNKNVLLVCAASAALAAAAGSTRGQSVTTVRLTNATLPGDSYNETSITVSATNGNHLIAACNFDRPGQSRRIFYGISTTGILGTPFSESGQIPVPPSLGGPPSDWHWTDPMTAASQVGDTLTVGSVIRPATPNGSAGFAVFRNPPGTGTLSVTDPGVVPLLGNSEDKGLMAIGPDTANTANETMYLTFIRRNYTWVDPGPPPSNQTGIMLMWRGSSGAWPGAGWAEAESRIDPGNQGEGHQIGTGPAPVVLSLSSTQPGRLVTVYEVPGNGTSSNFVRVETSYNQTPHNNLSANWESPELLNVERGTSNLDIFPIDSVTAFAGPLAVGQHPSICLDPNNPNRVYVTFIGSSTEYAPTGDQNTDIYIARSTDGGATFPLLQRLTDEMLRDIDAPGASQFEHGSDQFFPAITVDGYGGINIVYMRMPHASPNDTNPPVDVSYIRLTEFPLATTARLTPLRLTPLYNMFPQTAPRVGDYLSITSHKCVVYMMYPKVEDDPVNLCNAYITRVSVCVADSDNDGAVTISDVGAFAQGFANMTQATDLNTDGQHTGTDVECFLNAYTCGCAQQPQ